MKILFIALTAVFIAKNFQVAACLHGEAWEAACCVGCCCLLFCRVCLAFGWDDALFCLHCLRVSLMAVCVSLADDDVWSVRSFCILALQ